MTKINSARVNVMVADMDKSVDFYTNTLGLKLLNQYGSHYAEIQAPDLLIGLHPKSDKTVVGNNISIGFGVKEFDLLIEQLKSKGIDLKIEVDGWIRLAYFVDLDNNSLFFAENK
jgi:catechol 2,3-dioxygenase-like lactoylglutathione lyase family enzyme